MKKLFLTLVAIVATSLIGFSQTTLADAYTQLSKLSGMSVEKVGKVTITPSTSLSNVKTASVTVGEANVQNYRDKFVWMTENLPVRNMVIGANNMREMAAVYAAPAGNGLYNVLILKGNTLDGSFSVSYGQTNKAGVNAMQSSQVTMDSSELVLTPVSESVPGSYITMAN